MEIKVNPRKLTVALFTIVVVLTVINGVLLFFYFYLGDAEMFGLTDLFDFDREGNIPTLYSAVAMFFCVALLALTTQASRQQGDGEYLYWLGLTAIFFFLAVDEGARIHETVGELLEQSELHEGAEDFLDGYIDAQGVRHFLWAIPYGLITLVLAFAYARFLLALPADTRARFVGAGVLFLTGAVGFEMLSAREAGLHGYETIAYCAFYTAEEFFEMTGVVWFIHALLLHLARESGKTSFVIDSSV